MSKEEIVNNAPYAPNHVELLQAIEANTCMTSKEKAKAKRRLFFWIIVTPKNLMNAIINVSILFGATGIFMFCIKIYIAPSTLTIGHWFLIGLSTIHTFGFMYLLHLVSEANNCGIEN